MPGRLELCGQLRARCAQGRDLCTQLIRVRVCVLQRGAKRRNENALASKACLLQGAKLSLHVLLRLFAHERHSALLHGAVREIHPLHLHLLHGVHSLSLGLHAHLLALRLQAADSLHARLLGGLLAKPLKPLFGFGALGRRCLLTLTSLAFLCLC